MEKRLYDGIERLLPLADGAFYVYDGHKIERQMRRLKSKLPGFECLYSIKANPFEPVVRKILGGGIGADAASAAEVELAARLGAPAENVFYSSPGKTRRDIARALGKCTVIADSLGELRLLDQMAQERGVRLAVGVRVNPAFSMFGADGAPSKFGVDEERLLEDTGAFGNLTIEGIHVHLRSQVLDEAVLALYYGRVADLAKRLSERLGWAIRFINFGGGLGIPYRPKRECALDIGRLGELCREREWPPGARLIVESGRYLVCEAGRYVAPIVDIKHSRGTRYLIVQNGLNGFARPATAAMVEGACGGEGPSAEPLYTGADAFSISILERRGPGVERVAVVGNLCTAQDVLASEALLPSAEVGDHVVVSNAGSYAYALSPLLFGSHDMPAQFLLDED